MLRMRPDPSFWRLFEVQETLKKEDLVGGQMLSMRPRSAGAYGRAFVCVRARHGGQKSTARAVPLKDRLQVAPRKKKGAHADDLLWKEPAAPHPTSCPRAEILPGEAIPPPTRHSLRTSKMLDPNTCDVFTAIAFKLQYQKIFTQGKHGAPDPSYMLFDPHVTACAYLVHPRSCVGTPVAARAGV